MEPLDEATIRGSFVNCSQGEASRIKLPAGFGHGALPWADLDFLGWTDPAAPLRALLVVPGADGPTGVVLRRPEARKAHLSRSSMCRVCLTVHAASGVALFVAPLAGAAGRKGNAYSSAELQWQVHLHRADREYQRDIKHRQFTWTEADGSHHDHDGEVGEEDARQVDRLVGNGQEEGEQRQAGGRHQPGHQLATDGQHRRSRR